MEKEFYRAFEDTYRGSRELIKERLRVYLPFISPLKQLYDSCQAIDLGCGRGEWLELLGDEGFVAHGVDLDDAMLAACFERTLSVDNQEAVSALRQLPDESRVIVSGFHLAEHIPFTALQELVKESLRVLKPAGLLILETPNPENIMVGTTNFYLDPTHKRPIPPLLLSFIPEYFAFSRVKSLRLNAPTSLNTNNNICLMDVLGGASPDHAVIAQKADIKSNIALFDLVFSKKHGLKIDTLAERYEIGLRRRIDEQANVAETRAQTLQQTLEQRIGLIDERANTAQAHAQTLQQTLNEITHSRSWRLTALLRWVNLQWRLLRTKGARARIKAFVKKVTRRAATKIDSRPALRQRIVLASRRLGFYSFLRRTHAKVQANILVPDENHVSAEKAAHKEDLAPRAREIHNQLQKAIGKKEGEK